MAFAKKTWKDRIAEFPTRRRLTKEDNTSELVTVAREEGTLSQEGDAFSAENMNDLERRIDAEFTEVNGKLQFEKMTCFQTTAKFGSNGDVNISSGRSDWNYFIPIVVVNTASISSIQASPNGNSIYLYCAAFAGKTVEVNVICFGK